MKKLVAMLLALLMCGSALAGCSKTEGDETAADGENSQTGGAETTEDGTPAAAPGSYTYNGATTALATNWNSHTWENNSDQVVLGYLTSPLCSLSIKDSENGVYQWVYEMATSIKDVTKDHKADLTKYKVNLPEGQSADATESGYVFEIKLNDKAKWEDGTVINADSYIYSMKQLLAPEMHNYRANLFVAGESALAGAESYYYAGTTAWMDAASAYPMADLVKGDDGLYRTADGIELKIAPTTPLAYLGGNSLEAYIGAYGDAMFDVKAFESLVAAAGPDGYVPLNDENLALLTKVISFSPDWGESEADVHNYFVYGKNFPEVGYDETVGLYKVDDYTINYVTQSYIDINYFLTSCTDNWLVYEPYYEAGKDTSGKLVTTNYCTSKENSMSYGPYKLESVQADRQMVFVQNENWYGWEKQADGSLLSFTNFDVDGEKRQQYQTTRIVIDVMEESAMKQAFLKGELSDWTPSAEELTTYATSDQLYKVDETFTLSFFFNTNEAALKEMDKSKGNTNSVVLTNENFRKAFSLAVDRAEYVTATPGFKPAYALMNNLYFYDVYNDPNSSYRGSDEAMQAVCNLYGVEYGEGKAYATLKDAYLSISGYNLTEAKALMKTACDELTAAGLYKAGENIVIRIGWAKGAIQSSDNNQIALMNKFINAAVEGSGFGKVTLEGIGNLEDRYAAVTGGEYAIGYGAWGGAAFYPFRNLQVYCDNDQYDINEAACWDPSTETYTINVEGEDVTMSWKDWSNALISTGKFASADNKVKLAITANLEEAYLRKYYRIPLCGTTSCFLMSYKNSYYTEDYNIMYDFGGFRLMKYNYTDAEWTAFVAEQGGTLSYE